MSPSPPTCQEQATVVVHRGSFASDVQCYPDVTSYNIAQDWPREKVEQLREAVVRLIDANPILTGILHWGTAKEHTKNHLLITTGYHCNGNDFFVEIPAPNDIVSPALINPKDFKTFLDRHVVPLLPPIRTTRDALQNKLRVFGVIVMRLPDNHLFYSIRISHALADSSTYSLVVQQLCNLVESGTIGREFCIHWNHELKETHEPLGRLQNGWFLASAVLGTMRYYMFHKPAQPTFLLLSRAKIQQQKQNLCDHTRNEYLSSTDIIVAAIAQAMEHVHPYFFLWMSLRNRRAAVTKHHAGNLMKALVLISKQVAADPNEVRQIVKASTCSLINGDDNERIYPYRQALQSRGCFVSSWLGITSVLPNTICRVLPVELAKDGPVALVAIFEYNNDCIAIYHTADIDPTRGLLEEILMDRE